MINAYWITFTDKTAGCCEGRDVADAKVRANEATGKEIDIALILPYPATPLLGPRLTDCPPFCYSPTECAGRTSCPKNYACSE